MGLSIGQYRRFQEAERIAADSGVSSEAIFQALADVGEFLDQDVLVEAEFPVLDSEPVALAAPADGDTVRRIAVLTRTGTLYRGVLTWQEDSGKPAYEERGKLPLPTFDVDRDQILGLYWTRHWTLFRKSDDYLALVRKGHRLRVYQTAAKEAGDGREDLQAIGEAVPEVMRRCPVSVEPGRDLLEDLPSSGPPPGARSAVLIGGEFYAAVREEVDGRRRFSGVAVHGVEGCLLVADSYQAIHGYALPEDPTLEGTLERLWSRRLQRQPLCLCPLPSFADGRLWLLVGLEESSLALLAVVGREAVQALWRRLLDRLAEREGIASYAGWLEWSRGVLAGDDERSFDGRRVAAVLRLLIDEITGTADAAVQLEPVAEELFQKPLSLQQFLPVMSGIRNLIERWRPRSDEVAGAAALEQVYLSLPFEFQELVDLEFNVRNVDWQLSKEETDHTHDDETTSPDVAAFHRLWFYQRYNGRELKKAAAARPLARFAVNAEEWLETCAREFALPTPHRGSGLLRALALRGQILLVGAKHLVRVPKEIGSSFEFVTPEEWVPPSRFACLVRIPEGGDSISGLAIGTARTLLVVDVPASSGVAELRQSYELEPGHELIRAENAGGGWLFMVVETPEQGEGWLQLWLLSLPQQDVVAKMPLPFRPPREFSVLPAGPDPTAWSWWVAVDLADDRLGLLRIELTKEGELRLVTSKSRRLRGRIRSLATAFVPDDSQKRWVVAGTTAGDLYCLDASGADPSFDPLGFWHAQGSIRHLSCVWRPQEGVRILALTALGTVLVLDDQGRLLWRKQHATALRSGVLMAAEEETGPFLAAVDVEGVVWLFYSTSSDEAWRCAEELLPEIEDWPSHEGKRYEKAQTLRLLLEPSHDRWRRADGSLSRAAQLCLGHKLSRVLETYPYEEIKSWLSDFITVSRLDELIWLARTYPQGLSHERRLELVGNLLQKVVTHGRALGPEDSATASLLEDLLVALTRGLGRGLVRPDQLELFEVWWELPERLRNSPWVLTSLIHGACREARDAAPEEVFNGLFDQCSFLGPEAFRVLVLLAPESCQELARILGKVVRSLGGGKSGALTGEEVAVVRGRLPGLRRDVAAFFQLAVLLDESTPAQEQRASWRRRRWATLREILAAVHKRSPESLQSTSDEYRRFLECLDPYEVLAEDDFYQWNVEDQRQELNVLQQRELSTTRRSSAWGEWWNRVRGKLQETLQQLLIQRRRYLSFRSWVRLNIQPERVGTELLVLKAALEKDGRPRPSAIVRVRVAEDSGLLPVDNGLATEERWDDLPEAVEWLAFVEEGATWVSFEVSVDDPAEDYTHRHRWQARLPAEAVEEEGDHGSWRQLEEALVRSVMALRGGLHLLAAARPVRMSNLVSSLLQERGTQLVDLDDLLRGVGPGRADPAGLTAERILEELHARVERTGAWRIPGGPKRKRLLLFAASETAIRLLRPNLRPVLEELRRHLSQLEGPPVLWLLPFQRAAELHAALAPHSTYHSLYHLPKAGRKVEPAGEILAEAVLWIAVHETLSPERARARLDTFGHNLRLLAGWFAGARSAGISPGDFLRDRPDEPSSVRDELGGATLYELADVLRAAACRVRLPLRDLGPGLRSAEGVFSTAKKGYRRKKLVGAGEMITTKALNKLRSDPGAPRELQVHGFPTGGYSPFIPTDLQPLHRATHRDVKKIERSHRKWSERGILTVRSGIARVNAPYQGWLEDHLEKDPTGRTWIEQLLSDDLVDHLSFTELRAAGREGLEILCPALPKSSIPLVLDLGALYLGIAEDGQLSILCRKLTGSVGKLLETSHHTGDSDLLEDLLAELPAGSHFFYVPRQGTRSRHVLGFAAGGSEVDLSRVAHCLEDHSSDYVLILLGPALDSSTSGGSESEQLCPLFDPLLRETLKSSDPAKKFWNAVRNRIGLKRFSPFQVGNYLPADSKVFVGRDSETIRMLEGLDTTSFLILGGRQIGKTSLLQHVYGLLRNGEDHSGHTVLLVSCEGLESSGEFIELTDQTLRQEERPGISGRDLLALEKRLRQLEKPILFLNEVDGLAEKARDLMHRLRSLSEDRVCQFVMTGYHRAFTSLQQTENPLFHFVQGDVGEKAFVLGPLGERAARKLVDKLVKPPLELDWESDAARRKGTEKLVNAAYRIPILLQEACHQLVERLSEERRTTILLADVEAEVRDRPPVWSYLQKARAVEDIDDPLERAWTDLTLAAITYEKLFKPSPAPIESPRLRERSAEYYRFTVSDAIAAVHRTVAQYTSEQEADLVEAHFSSSSYHRFLDSMTLTVLLSPAPGMDGSYYFSDYIFPLELADFIKRQRQDVGDYLLQKVAEVTHLRSRIQITQTDDSPLELE